MKDGSFPRKLKLLERLQITRGLNGHQLPCGCVVGCYLTRAGHVLTVVDVDADDCKERAHQVDFVIDEALADAWVQPAL